MKTIVSIFPEDFSDLDFAYKISNDNLDIIEFRCEELIENPSEIIKKLNILEDFEKEVILTLRSIDEGGRKKFTKDDYITCILKISSLNLCSFIDLEMDFLKKNELLNLRRSIRQKTIFSIHKTEGLISGEDIKKYVEMADYLQADILKIVDRPDDFSDVISRMKEISNIQRPYKIISISMGEIGKISRVENSYYRPDYTFLSFKESSSIGQFYLNQAGLIKKTRPYFSRVFNSKIGSIQIVANEESLLEISIGELKNYEFSLSESPLLIEAERQILAYLSGQIKGFNLAYQFDENLSVLEKSIYNEVLKVGYGLTKTYEDIGIALGNKYLARMVGNTMKKNRLPLLIPCHRIINKNGKMGKYKPGDSIKKFLLELEGAIIEKGIDNKL